MGEVLDGEDNEQYQIQMRNEQGKIITFEVSARLITYVDDSIIQPGLPEQKSIETGLIVVELMGMNQVTKALIMETLEITIGNQAKAAKIPSLDHSRPCHRIEQPGIRSLPKALT